MADNLKQKTVNGVLWNSIGNFSVRGIQFLLMLIMARLLSPGDYGTIGLITVFLSVSQIFIDSGFGNALIRNAKATNEDLSTVFVFNIFISLATYSIVWFIAPFVSDFYHMPILTPVMRVLGLQLIIGALGAIQGIVYTKNLNFKIKARISVVGTLLSGICGVTFAFYGFGVWALVWQTLIHGSLTTIMNWFFSTWKPSILFSKTSFKSMFNYGSNLLVTNLLGCIYDNIYPLVIGKFYSPSVLGHSSRAQHWAQFPSSNITNILRSVTFPVLAKIVDDEPRLISAYRRILKCSAFIIFPLMLCLSAVSKPLIVITIGVKWGLCATLLQIVCFKMMWYPIHAINLNLLMVKGRSDLYLRLEIIKKILGVSILILTLPYGIIVMTYGGVVSSILCLFINTFYTGKLIHMGFLKQMKDLTPTLFLSLIMFGFVSLVVHLTTNIYIQLIFGTIVGFVIYLGGSHLFKFEELKEVVVIFKEFKNKKNNSIQ